MTYLAWAAFIILTLMMGAFAYGIAAEFYFQAKYRNSLKFWGTIMNSLGKVIEKAGKDKEKRKGDILELVNMLEKMKEAESQEKHDV